MVILYNRQSFKLFTFHVDHIITSIMISCTHLVFPVSHESDPVGETERDLQAKLTSGCCHEAEMPVLHFAIWKQDRQNETVEDDLVQNVRRLPF